jgi:hypothetical protein
MKKECHVCARRRDGEPVIAQSRRHISRRRPIDSGVDPTKYNRPGALFQLKTYAPLFPTPCFGFDVDL